LQRILIGYGWKKRNIEQKAQYPNVAVEECGLVDCIFVGRRIRRCGPSVEYPASEQEKTELDGYRGYRGDHGNFEYQ